MRARLLPVLAASALAACHLVDQRDFDAEAGAKPRPPAVAAAPPAPRAGSLVRIVWAVPPPEYRDAVARAVRQALARRRDVLFTVTGLAAPEAAPDRQEVRLAAVSGHARDVAEAVIAGGADRGQVELAVRTDAAARGEEVRIDVR